MKYQFLGFLVHDVIEHFPVLCSGIFSFTTFEISVTSFSSTWRYTNIFPYFFPVVFQTTTFEISVTSFSSTWRYKKIFPYFFPVPSQTTTFEISVTLFSSAWRYKTFLRTFSLYFFKPQRFKYQLLSFLVRDVIKHFPVPFETSTFEILVSCFSSTCRNKTFFVLFQTTTSEISVTSFSSTWRYTNNFPYFFPVVFQTTTFEISVTSFSSTWRYKIFSRTFSNDNVWNVSYLVF